MLRTNSTPSADRRDGGFTLVELIVVLVVLAILTAVAVNRFSASRKQGRIRAAQATAASYELAVEQFKSDHRGKLPHQTTPPASLQPENLTDPAGTKYMRSIPDSVKNGNVTVTYKPWGETYVLEVRLVDDNITCVVGPTLKSSDTYGSSKTCETAGR